MVFYGCCPDSLAFYYFRLLIKSKSHAQCVRMGRGSGTMAWEEMRLAKGKKGMKGAFPSFYFPADCFLAAEQRGKYVVHDSCL